MSEIVPLFDAKAREHDQGHLASVIRTGAPLGPFGPNSLAVIQQGGTVHMTGAEAEAAARAVIESDWLERLLTEARAEAWRESRLDLAHELRESGAWSEVRMAEWVEMRAARIARPAAQPATSTEEER